MWVTDTVEFPQSAGGPGDIRHPNVGNEHRRLELVLLKGEVPRAV